MSRRLPHGSAKRGRLFGTVLSIAAHLVVLVALLSALTNQPETPESPPMTVTLVDARILAPKLAPVAATAPSPPTPPPPAPTPTPPRNTIRPAPAPPNVRPLPMAAAPKSDQGPGLSDAQLSGAATAESVPAGRPCNMAQTLQNALRKDPLVLAAVAGSAGKAIMVWNGDWVRNNGEDGKGLAAVREAIMWEVAFAPAACRAESVHGLVLISVNGTQGPVRLAVGSAEWRWSDLLTPH